MQYVSFKITGEVRRALGVACILLSALICLSLLSGQQRSRVYNCLESGATDATVVSAADLSDGGEEGLTNAVSNADAAASGTHPTEPYVAASAEVLEVSDVGGELEAEEAVYDGELDVPANIRLERPAATGLTLHKPVDSATVSSLFGYRQNPVTGRYTFHSGYDLAAAAGSAIYAMFDGRVTTAGWDDGYGRYIIIDHDGLQTLYAHCSKLLVSRGDRVKGGDKIALVGSTGNSTGAHLHVEVRVEGQRYDPEWLLGGLYG